MAKVSTTIETVTPTTAEAWIEKNKDNRPIRDHHVALLAKEMREGRWHLNGEAIIFDDAGMLLDGQHRLWAAYEHGQTFQTIVVRGVEPEAFKTIDSGMKRSAGDVLTKAGMSYGNLSAAALRLVHFYETGRKDHLAITRMSNAETMACATRYPRIVDAVALVGPNVALKRLCSQSAIAATVYFALECDQEDVQSFLDALSTGANLRKGDPRLTCRNYFINRKEQRSGSLLARHQFALLVKAWNAAAEGRDLSILKFVDSEEFPEFSHRTKGRRKPTPRAIA